MRPSVSIIVPVYNAELCLQACVNSIIKQSFTDFELILVDDGSQDDSGRLCDNFSIEDCRIKVIHQENSGVTKARHVGVNLAKGDWVLFVDADDSLDLNCLQILYGYAKTHKTDLVVGNVSSKYINDNGAIPLKDYTICCVSGTKINTSVWAKLYKRNLLTNWVFDIPRFIVYSEDTLMNIRYSFLMSNDPILLSDKIYNYNVDNNESCVHKFRLTLGYIRSFNTFQINSIPPKLIEAYKKEILFFRIKQLMSMVYSTKFDFSFLKDSYVKDLLVESSKVGLKLPFMYKILLNTTNTTIHRGFQFIKSIIQKL